MDKWLSVRLRTKWFWVRITLLSLMMKRARIFNKIIMRGIKFRKKFRNGLTEIKKLCKFYFSFGKGFWNSKNKSLHFGSNFAYSSGVDLQFCNRHWRCNIRSRKPTWVSVLILDFKYKNCKYCLYYQRRRLLYIYIHFSIKVLMKILK